MGGHFWTEIAVWTLFFLCSVKIVFSSDIEFLQDLGLESLPDVSKINVSQDEYTRMMSIYLQRLQDSQEPDTIPKLITFNSDRKSWRRRRDDVTRLRFAVHPSNVDVEVENAELRLLAPSLTNRDSMTMKIYQVLSPRRRRLLEEKIIYLSQSNPKWCTFDVTTAMKGWLQGERNLGLDLECTDCINTTLRPLEASLSALVFPESRRTKRNTYEEGRRTDCRNTGDNKPKCCRHTMNVNFKKIKELETIIQPKNYEAGFCKGRCPPNYNHATNHSRIQSLVHKYDRRGIPRTCCAPSKLESLEILRVDPYDPTKLSVERWDNMKVLECACS